MNSKDIWTTRLLTRVVGCNQECPRYLQIVHMHKRHPNKHANWTIFNYPSLPHSFKWSTSSKGSNFLRMLRKTFEHCKNIQFSSHAPKFRTKKVFPDTSRGHTASCATSIRLPNPILAHVPIFATTRFHRVSTWYAARPSPRLKLSICPWRCATPRSFTLERATLPAGATRLPACRPVPNQCTLAGDRFQVVPRFRLASKTLRIVYV